MVLRPGEYQAVPDSMKAFFPPNRTMARGGVHADGSCFYHAVASALNEDRYHQHSMESRRKIGHNLGRWREPMLVAGGDAAWKGFWKPFGVTNPPSIDSMRKAMKDTKVWADVWAIRWTMQQLKTNLIFFNMAREPHIYCGVEDFDFPRTVLVAWIDHSHFEPIVEMAPQGGVPRSIFSANDELVRYIKKRYGKDCANVKLRDVVYL